MKPKVLLFDIEISPNIVYTWPGKMYEVNVIDFNKPWELLSFAYKELGKDKTYCFTKQNQKTDEALVKKLYDVMNSADIVIGHNLDAFDIKKGNVKFLKYGLHPYKPIQTIDTKKVAKARFAFESNSLNHLAKFLGIGHKAHTGGFQLWLDCMANKPSGWVTMKSYNIQDVILLEEVYLFLRPWIKKHPNISIRDVTSCPTCSSLNVVKKGFDDTKVPLYQRYKCNECGKWSRSRLAIKKSKKLVLVN